MTPSEQESVSTSITYFLSGYVALLAAAINNSGKMKHPDALMDEANQYLDWLEDEGEEGEDQEDDERSKP